MSLQSAFCPQGNTLFVAVTTTAQTITMPTPTGLPGPIGSNYRFNWQGTGIVYVYPVQSGAAPPTATVPTAVAAGYAGFSMQAGTIETFTLPPGFVASVIGTAAGTLEITEGVGT